MKWIGPDLVAALAAAGTDAYRIASGFGERIERFGDGAIISHADSVGSLLSGLDEWCGKTEVSLQRVYARQLVVGPGKENAPRLVSQPAPPDSLGVAQENGLRYGIDFLGGYSCGLFLDQRENRMFLRELKPKRVLNTFAYTCAFSVAAAAAGAETVSVDLAKGSLERGRANFALNDLSTDGHRFLADDALDVLARLARRGEKFDALILDPPTFSRSKTGKVFRVEKDFGALLERALEVAAPGASLLLSTNCSTLRREHLCEMARRTVRGSLAFQDAPPPPDIPPGHGATTVWARLA